MFRLAQLFLVYSVFSDWNYASQVNICSLHLNGPSDKNTTIKLITPAARPQRRTMLAVMDPRSWIHYPESISLDPWSQTGRWARILGNRCSAHLLWYAHKRYSILDIILNYMLVLDLQVNIYTQDPKTYYMSDSEAGRHVVDGFHFCYRWFTGDQISRNTINQYI